MSFYQDSDCESLIASDAALTAEEFLMWAVERAERLLTPLLELVFDVCHVVLGLRPQCRHHERDIGQYLKLYYLTYLDAL